MKKLDYVKGNIAMTLEKLSAITTLITDKWSRKWRRLTVAKVNSWRKLRELRWRHSRATWSTNNIEPTQTKGQGILSPTQRCHQTVGRNNETTNSLRPSAKESDNQPSLNECYIPPTTSKSTVEYPRPRTIIRFFRPVISSRRFYKYALKRKR
jgi:hypothetical protein